jgi:hypothetical protein
MELAYDILVEALLLILFVVIFFSLELYLWLILFSVVYYVLLLINSVRHKQDFFKGKVKYILNVVQLGIPLVLWAYMDINFSTVTTVLIVAVVMSLRIRLSYRLFENGYGLLLISLVILSSYVFLYIILVHTSVIEEYNGPTPFKLDNQHFPVVLKSASIIWSLAMLPHLLTLFLRRKNKLVNDRNKIVKNRRLIRILVLAGFILLLLAYFIFLAFFLYLIFTPGSVDISFPFILYAHTIMLFSAWSIVRKVYRRHDAAAPDMANCPDYFLYLRSFNQQHVGFWNGKLYKFKHLFSDGKVNLASRVNVLPEFLSFENYFSRTINAANYKLVSLGNPNDRILRKQSVAIYPGDDTWKQELDKLLDDCKAVLFQIGDSRHIAYELEQILAKDIQDRVYIITKPKNKHLHFAFLNRMILFLTFRRQARWEPFKAVLEKEGFTCDLPYYDGAIYIARNRNIELLVKDCQLPNEYLGAITDRLYKKELKSDEAISR